jgi:hypothetical protein
MNRSAKYFLSHRVEHPNTNMRDHNNLNVREYKDNSGNILGYYTRDNKFIPIAEAIKCGLANTKKCAAEGCFENHFYHFCRICGDKNSLHKSSNCPKQQCVLIGQASGNPTDRPVVLVHVVRSSSERIVNGFVFTSR